MAQPRNGRSHSVGIDHIMTRVELIALARMKRLEDKNFAEYMLVGTLLSALCALLMGVHVKQIQ